MKRATKRTRSKKGPRKSVTTSMIAEQLGLSRATVSYVLNGQAKERKISDKTIKRVEEAVRESNYVPNKLARSLRLQQTGVIGFVTRGLGYNYVEYALEGMLPVFDEAGYAPFLSTNYWDPKREEREMNSLLQHRVEGIICIPMPYNRETLYESFMQRGIPMVFLSDVLEGMEKANYVLWDAASAAKVATRHLIDTGRQRIGFIGANHQTLYTRLRYTAFEETIRESGLVFNPDWVAWELLDFSYDIKEKIRQLVDRVFQEGKRHPDALFVSIDSLAILVLDILESRGIRVPDDVAVAGLGDLFLSDHHGISLTTVREPIRELGRRSAMAVLELIEDPEQAPIQEKLVSNELIVRHSTDPTASREEVVGRVAHV